MSSWDFNSWDYKSSYTYKVAMQIKRIVESNLYEKRRTGNYNNNHRKYNNQNEHINNNDQYNDQPSSWGSAYQYRYRGADIPQEQANKRVYVTPPPGSNRDNPGYQSVNTARNNRAKETISPNTIVKYKKSVAPFYIVGLFSILYAAFLPMYRLFDFVFIVVLSILLYFISSKIFKGTKVYIKIEEKPKTTGDLNTDKIIENGKNFLKQIYEANSGINNQQLFAKINRLYEVCNKIISFVAENPKKSPQIRKFMNYYVPTTLKLLKSYDRLEEQRIEGENIKSTMQSIEQAIDTIVAAFEKQLDSLFVDEALDISTDISVLEGMLSQEGLLGSDFDKNKQNNKL